MDGIPYLVHPVPVHPVEGNTVVTQQLTFGRGPNNGFWWMLYYNLYGNLRDICFRYDRDQSNGKLLMDRQELSQDDKFALFKEIRQVFYSCMVSIYQIYNHMNHHNTALQTFLLKDNDDHFTSEDSWNNVLQYFGLVDACVQTIFREVCERVLDDEKNDILFTLNPDNMPMPMPLPTKDRLEQKSFKPRLENSSTCVPGEPIKHKIKNTSTDFANKEENVYLFNDKYWVRKDSNQEKTWWDNFVESIEDKHCRRQSVFDPKPTHYWWALYNTPNMKESIRKAIAEKLTNTWCSQNNLQTKARVRDIVDWKFDAQGRFALKMRCDRQGNSDLLRRNVLEHQGPWLPGDDWPGDDWPNIIDKMFAEEEHNWTPFRNNKGSKATYAGITYIFKHKGPLLFAKFQEEHLRFFLTKLQSRDKVKYEYFYIDVKKDDILAWFKDYTKVKTTFA